MELEPIIGLEIHAQVATQTKLWCGCSNDDFEAEPNTLICPVCLGYPGALPVLNKEALEMAIETALALNCSIPKDAKFDRKNYFYPDLPMGYQISQFDQPISKNGYLEIVPLSSDRKGGSPLRRGEFKAPFRKNRVGITRLHLENDAGKLVHEGEWSLVDFNRSGTPLMEIVTEPDLRSPEEARVFAEELQKLLRTVGSSDADMYKGQMRFDASISLRPKAGESPPPSLRSSSPPKGGLYPRAEIKNLNSFRSLEAALKYEIRRQEELWKEGNPPQKEMTVGWVEEEQRTRLMREKESAADYRYFPEPDVPPLVVDQKKVKRLREALPELPAVFRVRLKEQYDLSEEQAEVAVANINLGRFFEEVAKKSKDAKTARTFVFSVLLSHLKEDLIDVSRSKVQTEHLVELIKTINAGKISASAAKEVLEETYLTGKDPLVIIKERGLEQVSDEGALEKICDDVLRVNVKIVEDYRGGKEKAFAALVGKVMAATKGQANPGVVTKLLRGKV